MTEVLIMANDHQHYLLKAALIHENTDNVVQNHNDCVVEGRSKRVPSFTV